MTKLPRVLSESGIQYVENINIWVPIYSTSSTRPHLTQMSSAISFITCRLTSIRVKGDLEININLFKILIMPKITMLSSC
jgi:hypothetical protein